MSNQQAGFFVGSEISGYRIQNIVEFQEIHSLVYELHHQGTGATHLHIANNDQENAFGVIFKTVPADSTGVAHILEHIILCGSQSYPVRDPFFSMIKRSLSSFMNAMTASDWTMYPFATPNPKDFYNLLEVYLDAVFFPRLSVLSFKQEGHRLEIVPAPHDDTDREAGVAPAEWELEYQGVVYNEMKGAMSSPDQIMSRGLLQALFPDTTYSYNSGGEPSVIPSLTHGQVTDFHRRHYHPSNAFFYTYGNLPLSDHLDYISAKVLSRFEPITPGTEVPSQRRWSRPRRFSRAYPITRAEFTDRKCQVCLAWLTADTTDSFEVFTLIVLEQVLLGNPASPLRKALIDSGLGSTLSDGTGYDADLKDTMFACGLKDVSRDDTARIESLIMDTLSGIVEHGLAAELIDAAIHQIEFHRKEVTNIPYPYGIKLLLTLSGSWIHGTDPAEIIQIGPYIERLYAEMDKGPFLEKQIQKYLLQNPHRVTFTLEPDTEMAEQEAARIKRELRAIKQSLTTEEIEKIRKEGRQLEQMQAAEEDLSVLPTLALSDIPPEIQTADEVHRSENLLCYPQPTSGIVYYCMLGGIDRVSADLLPLIPFFCVALPRMGTEKHDYVELTRLLERYTGGVGFSAQARTAYTETADCVFSVACFGKALSRQQDKLFALIEEILLQADFSDLIRLKQLLGEYRAAQESSIVQNGHRLAISLASRNLSLTCALSEVWNGVHQLQFIREITKTPDESQLKKISRQLSEIAGTVFVRSNLKTGLIGEKRNLPQAVETVRELAKNLPAPAVSADDRFACPLLKTGTERPREGWSTASAVSFVASVFVTVRMGHKDAPVLAVISKLLRSSFLHREIREKGGAYGGFSLYDMESGRFCMASYRDPHIANTLNVYQRAVDYIQSGDYTSEEITESVLQVCSDIDKPLTPAEKGRQAFYQSQIGLTDEKRRDFKKGVLAVTRDSVLSAAKRHFPDNPRKMATAVISGEDQLKAENLGIDPPLTLHSI